jgi:adenine/guanine phosphoribosyltransferase-like PRPP-binding protein
MARMTEEEANVLDEEITNADITLTMGKGGLFMRQRQLLDALDRASADYIITRAMATNKMPMEILGEMVHEKIIANASL